MTLTRGERGLPPGSSSARRGEKNGPGVPTLVLPALLALFLLAWGARLFVYAPAELGLDGYLSVGLALQPTGRILAFLARDVHPPFFYLLLKAWLATMGVNPLVARWPTVATGTLTLALLYRLAAPLAGRVGALVAVSLLVLSPAHLAASASVRDFGLGLCLSVLALTLGWEIERPDADTCARPDAHRARRWLVVALAAATALSLATWYFHLVFLAIQIVGLTRRRRAHLPEAPSSPDRVLALGLALGCAANLPWLAFAGWPLVAKLVDGVTVSGQPPAPAPLGVVAADLGRAVAGELPGPAPVLLGGLATVGLLGVGILRAIRRGPAAQRWAIRASVGVGLGAAVVDGLTSLWAAPTLLGRYGLILLPWLALAQAWAWDPPSAATAVAPLPTRSQGHPAPGWSGTPEAAAQRLTRGLVLGLAALVLAGQAHDFHALLRLEGFPYSSGPGSAPSLARLEADRRSGDGVVFTDLARYGQYLARGNPPASTVTIHVAGSAFLRDVVAASAATDRPDAPIAALFPLLARSPRVWLLYDQPIDPTSLATLEERLGTGLFRLGRWTDGASVTELFGSGPPLTRQPVGARFGPAIELAAAAISPAGRPAGPLFVELEWQAIGQPTADETVFAHLVDGADRKVAQHDGAPALGWRPTSSWHLGETIVDRFVVDVPLSAAPGSYHLLVGLYRGANRLKLASGADALALGPIVVAAR